MRICFFFSFLVMVKEETRDYMNWYCSLGARHLVKHLTCFFSFNPLVNPEMFLLSPFTDGELKFREFK